jgi:hypothetical protein
MAVLAVKINSFELTIASVCFCFSIFRSAFNSFLVFSWEKQVAVINADMTRTNKTFVFITLDIKSILNLSDLMTAL